MLLYNMSEEPLKWLLNKHDTKDDTTIITLLIRAAYDDVSGLGFIKPERI